MNVRNVIVVCDYGYVEGGAARIACETALALSARGLKVTFFCAVGPVSEELKNSTVDVCCLEQQDILQEKNRIKGVLRGLSNRKAKNAFNHLLKKFDPQNTVIHVHTWTKGVSSVIFKVAHKNKFKVFITVHDYFLICPNGGLFNYKTSKICEHKPMSIKCITCNCDARSYSHKVFRVLRQKRQNRNVRRNKNISYIFISDFSKREFLKRYNKIPQENQFFLSNMISFPTERERVVCENNNTYLFIGGITEVKGIRIFCKAVTEAKVNAIVIGQGILKKELEDQYPNIDFIGWKTKEEMIPYLNQTRCLVFPSIWYECSPLTPLEVMSMGIPVICSDLNAASEQLKDGKDGLIFNGNDVNDLVKVLEQSGNDELIARLSKEAFKSFNDRDFSQDKYVCDLISIFEGNND